MKSVVEKAKNGIHFRMDVPVKACAEGVILIFAVGWLCFESLIVCVVGLVFLPIYIKFRNNSRDGRRQAAIWGEFRNVISILYSSTAAGNTLEKALRDARQDMKVSEGRYPLLLPEFDRICARLDRNVPMEDVLSDFALRSHDEDIACFIEILLIARRSGGSLAEIIRHTADTMTMRVEVNSEIETILAGKKGEWRVMLIVPPAILIYMKICSAEYMAVLYTSMVGRCTMAGALAVYLAAVWIGRRILDIHI